MEDGNGRPNISGTLSTTDIESICDDDSVFDESELDDVSPDLILDCADLSQYRPCNITRSLEEICDARASPFICNAPDSLDSEMFVSPDNFSNIPIDSASYEVLIHRGDMQSRLTPILVGLECKPVDSHQLREKQSTAGFHGMRTGPSSSPQNRSLMLGPVSTCQKKSKQKIRALSDKKDLLPGEIKPVAEMLLPDSAIKGLEDYYLTQCKMVLPIETPITTCGGAEERVAAAFDLVVSRTKQKPKNRLQSRIAHFQLAQAVAELKAVPGAHSHYVHPPCYRNSDNTIAIDAYLKLKARTSNISLSRPQLSEHARVAQRWSDISSSSLPLLEALSPKAETIM